MSQNLRPVYIETFIESFKGPRHDNYMKKGPKIAKIIHTKEPDEVKDKDFSSRCNPLALLPDDRHKWMGRFS